MAVLVGIDEAGFGPILGPLVVSSSTFSLPRELLSADLWQLLGRSVGDRRKGLAGRLLIADSKKAYSRKAGITHLQRTVMASLRCLGGQPATFAELLSRLDPDFLERLGEYPWYKTTGAHCLSADVADTAIAATVLADDLTGNRMQLLGMRSCCLDVAYYNRMVSRVRNKASVLFTATSRLIKEAFDNFGRDALHIVVDRQGGRVRYGSRLQMMFPDTQLAIIRESPRCSSYQLQADGRQMHLHFAVGADQRFLPVSLASMVSKYLRELLVASINRYFMGFSPGLKPTAGYWKDGLRFIEDLRTRLPHVAVDDDRLIRSR